MSTLNQTRSPRSFHKLATARGLGDLAYVGPATLRDFEVLGVKTLAQLAEAEAPELYRRLCELTFARHDPCCEDVFASAIAQARDENLPAEQKCWWYWSRLRKQRER